MRKIYLTESQFKKYIKYLNEEESSVEKRIGPFSTPQEAAAELNRLRIERGFSKYDSWVDGNYVVVQIEKNRFDDDYLGDMITSLNSTYGKVAESRR